MEFPNLGRHCSEPTCKQLDFLPMKCDACSKIFCRDHIVYATHNCCESYKKNNQVPVCPLCSLPCPLRKGESPDAIVGKHIESQCLSDPARERRKVYTNKCSKKGCKKKELIHITCGTCQLRFCLHHRHEQDHNCKGFHNSGNTVSKAGAAAIHRAQQKAVASSPQSLLTSAHDHASDNNINSNKQKVVMSGNFSSLQEAMTEEEALAMAMHMSLSENTGGDTDHAERIKDQVKTDYLLAQALALSEQEAVLSRQRPLQSIKA